MKSLDQLFLIAKEVKHPEYILKLKLFKEIGLLSDAVIREDKESISASIANLFYIIARLSDSTSSNVPERIDSMQVYDYVLREQVKPTDIIFTLIAEIEDVPFDTSGVIMELVALCYKLNQDLKKCVNMLYSKKQFQYNRIAQIKEGVLDLLHQINKDNLDESESTIKRILVGFEGLDEDVEVYWLKVRLELLTDLDFKLTEYGFNK